MKTNLKNAKSLKTFESKMKPSQKLSNAKKRKVRGGDFSFDDFSFDDFSFDGTSSNY